VELSSGIPSGAEKGLLGAHSLSEIAGDDCRHTLSDSIQTHVAAKSKQEQQQKNHQKNRTTK
jgi:hypothetical protein